MSFEPTIKIIWHEGTARWRVCDNEGYEMFMFPDCRNTHLRFVGLEKDKVNVFSFIPSKVLRHE